MKADFDITEIQGVFAEESKELLETMELSLLDLQKGIHIPENLNGIFRAVHTLKGSSGLFQFEEIQKFAHELETFLDSLRESPPNELDPNMIQTLFQCTDHLKILTENYLSGAPDMSQETLEKGAKLLSALSGATPAEPAGPSEQSTSAIPKNENESPPPASHEWHISLRLHEDAWLAGLDILKPLSWLKKCGEVLTILPVTETIPLNNFDPEKAYLGFEIRFLSETNNPDEIEDAFEFWDESCDIRILPASQSIQLWGELPETEETLMHIWEQLGYPPEFLKERSKDAHTPGEQPPTEDLIPSPKPENKKKATGSVMRVDTKKMDELINLVGELVLKNSQLLHYVSSVGDKEMGSYVQSMSRLVEEVRNISLNMRMLPIEKTFRKMERVAIDIAHKLGKKIQFEVSGAEAELDKTIIEKINDPLVHLIRNAVDHGIETPEERVAAGKPEVGTIRLSARHETGCMLIEISDDGSGLNTQHILDTAIERGLADKNIDYTEDEIADFIFQPGFSTANAVTEVSGRGVGMDVVRKNIDSMRGNITIQSKRGQGTRFIITLPLTLAIIDGFMVEAAGQKFIIPLDMVMECLDLKADELSNNLYNLRGEPLPCIRLSDIFQYRDSHLGKRESLVVTQVNQKHVGIIVNSTVGEYHTVVKSLGPVFKNLDCVSGSTITGDGEIALILDMQYLLSIAEDYKG